MNRDLKIFNILTKYNKERIDQYNEKQMDNWYAHYEKEISIMYNTCVNPKLDITFDEFVEVLFLCTYNKFNNKTFKYNKPLI